MPDLLAGVATTYLDLDAHLADYTVSVAGLDAPIWKVERAQTFREPGNASWEAFVAGDRSAAMEYAEPQRPEIATYFTELHAAGSSLFRVRVVERPLTPYLRWALRLVLLRAQASEQVHVVTSDAVAPHEARFGRLPELLLLGQRVGYAIDYGVDGTPRGAYRFDDRATIDRCVALLSDLYSIGEDLPSFFDREVAPLPPPVSQHT